MFRFLAPLLVTILSGCAFLNAESKCEQWKSEGLMYSTIDACSKCVRSLGSTNYEAVSGCAVGMDAATLLDTTLPKNAATPQ